MTYEEYAQYKNNTNDSEPDIGLVNNESDPLSEWKRNQYLKEIDNLSGSDSGLGSLSSFSTQNKIMQTQDELLAKKQERISSKVADLTKDDSNLMLKAKAAYNTVNNMWDGKDLKANYMGKEQSMSNKIFEDVDSTMAESEAKRQELIDQYNMAEDDPNAKHKVYQLRLVDGYDVDGNPIYTYKTGIAETSAAERYKNQIIKGGYEVLSEKGFANAEEWENKWHGLKSNIADRTFEEGFNTQGKNIKDISGFGSGYSEIYNTGAFDSGQTQEELIQNKLRSEALSKASSGRRLEGYGKGSDSIVDAFQAGLVKTGVDLADVVLDVATPGGNNTWLDDVKEQSNIDKMVGYNRKSADKAIGEATARFNSGDYTGAMTEVLANPQIAAESLPAMAEMFIPLGWATKGAKLAKSLESAKKAGDATEVSRISNQIANEIGTAQKGMQHVLDNAGYYAAVAQTTNNQIDERVKNNEEAGAVGGDSLGEVAAVFSSNMLSLGLDRVAFSRITGIDGGKKAFADAFGFVGPDGQKQIIKGVLGIVGNLAEAGATEASQEYLQTWNEIINTELGTAKNGTLEKILNDKENQDEAIGGMLAGAAGGIHIGLAADTISGLGGKVYDSATGAEEKRQADKLKKEDALELRNILQGYRTVDNLPEGSEPGSKVSASKATALSVARNGHNVVVGSLLNSLGNEESTVEKPAIVVNKLINAVAREYSDVEGAGKTAGSKVLMNRNITSFVSNVMSELNNLKWNDKVAKPIYDKAVSDGLIDPDKIDINRFMSDKIDEQKLEISEAIGKSLDHSGLDISKTIVDKFKEKYITSPLEKAKKRTRIDEAGKSSVAQDLSSFVNAKKGTDIADIVNPKLSEDESKSILNNAKVLYAIGGNRDEDLADLIEQIQSQSGSESVTVNKSAMNVASDVLKNGFQFGKQSKKSLSQHNEDIYSSIGDSIETLDSGSNDKIVNSKLSDVDKNVESILEFAASRTQGESEYVKQNDLDLFQTAEDVEEAIKEYVKKMIMATPVGKYKSKQLDKFGNPIEKSENPIVKFEQNEKERLTNSVRDTKLEERFGIKNNSRAIIAGATKNGLMSSFIYENRLIIEELQKSVNVLNELKAKLIESGKEDKAKDIEVKIKTANELANHLDIMNKVYKQIHIQANYKLNTKDQYIKQVIEPGKEFTDLNGVKRIATPKDIVLQLQYDKEFDRKIKEKFKSGVQQTEEPGIIESTKSEDTTLEEQKQVEKEIKDELNVDLNSKEESVFETANEFTTISGSEYFIETDDSAYNASSAIKDLYEKVISSKLMKKFRKVIEKRFEADHTGFRATDSSRLFTGMISYLDGQFNDINYAHEMFHAMSYKNLEKKLTKKDREFVSGIKNLIQSLDISTREKFDTLVSGRKSERLYQDIKQLQDSVSESNNLFEKELAAILYSNTDARKLIVTMYDNTLEASTKQSRRKDMADFIQSVFKAYKEIADMLKKAFSGDKDNGINTKSDAYRDMVRFVGNSLKQEANRTNTYDEIKSEYDNISSRFDIDTKNIDLIDKKSKNDDKSIEGVLRSISGDGRKIHVVYETSNGNKRSLNSRGLESLIVKLNNQTLSKSDMSKLQSIIKSYDSILSSKKDTTSVDDFYNFKEQTKNEKEKEKAKQEYEKQVSTVVIEKQKNVFESKEPEIDLTDMSIDLNNIIDKNDGSGRVFNSVTDVVSKIKELNNPTEETIKDIEAIMQVAKELNKCKGK